MIFRGDVFRFVILSSPELPATLMSTLQELHLAYLSPYGFYIWKDNFSSKFACTYSYTFFKTFTRLFLQLSLTISLALISTNTFSDKHH